MGYYTSYTLEFRVVTEDIMKAQCSHDIPDGARFCPECGLMVKTSDSSELVLRHIKTNRQLQYGLEQGAVKWHEHDRDMFALSREFPNVLFVLTGFGEEPGDIWRKYYLDGMGYLVNAQVVFPSFDPDNLREPEIHRGIQKAVFVKEEDDG